MKVELDFKTRVTIVASKEYDWDFSLPVQPKKVNFAEGLAPTPLSVKGSASLSTKMTVTGKVGGKIMLPIKFFGSVSLEFDFDGVVTAQPKESWSQASALKVSAPQVSAVHTWCSFCARSGAHTKLGWPGALALCYPNQSKRHNTILSVRHFRVHILKHQDDPGERCPLRGLRVGSDFVRYPC